MIEGREFQVWEYRTSHGSLLIRSPALAGFSTNIDIIFKGTTHIIGPMRLGLIDTIAESAGGIPAEISLDDQIYRIWKIASEAGNLFIIAAFMNMEENEKAPFESIFII